MNIIETLYDRLAFVRAKISNTKQELYNLEREEIDITDQIAMKIVENR